MIKGLHFIHLYLWWFARLKNKLEYPYTVGGSKASLQNSNSKFTALEALGTPRNHHTITSKKVNDVIFHHKDLFSSKTANGTANGHSLALRRISLLLQCPSFHGQDHLTSLHTSIILIVPSY